MLLYDERNLKAPVSRLQCAEDAFVLDLQWRPPPDATRDSSGAERITAGVTDTVTSAIAADQRQQHEQQRAPDAASRPSSRPSSPSKSSSSRSRFADENTLQPPAGVTFSKPGVAAQPPRPGALEVPPAPDRPRSALGSPPRSPRATMRQLLDGGSPVRDSAASAAIAAAAAETQRQVCVC